jgi:hypothetical protein
MACRIGCHPYGVMSIILAISLAGWRRGRSEQAWVARLLDDVAAAAEKMRRAQDELTEAREELRAKVRVAHVEGIPAAAIARAAGLSRQRITQLLKGEPSG